MHPDSDEPADTGQDQVLLDEGIRIGYCGREADSTVCLLGQPSGELLIEIAKYFGIERKINWPSVILDRNLNPIDCGEDHDDE